MSNNRRGKPFYRSKGFFIAKRRADEKKTVFNIQLVDDHLIILSGPSQAFTPNMKQEIKAFHGSYSAEDKGWILPKRFLETTSYQHMLRMDDTKTYEVPKFVYQLLKPFPETIMFNSKAELVKLDYTNEKDTIKLSDLPPNFQSKLYSFQKRGVEFGIKNNGRVLIADEMGVGKTAQALALASLYRDEWPFIVFAPSSLRYVWKDEILNWFEDIQPDEVQVIVKSNQLIEEDIKALVISYDLGAKMADEIDGIGKFQLAIADEAHYLKNPEAKRTENILPVIQKCKRCILLAGTPTLARPKEIYNQLAIIRPDVFSNFKEFGYRYCSPKPNVWSRSTDFSGASNLKELHHILTNSIMIRRLKKEVLAELPSKIRQKIQIETNPEYVDLMKKALQDHKGGGKSESSNKLTLLLKKFMGTQWANDDENFEESFQNMEKTEEIEFPQLFECYRYTGLAKLDGARRYIKEILQNEEKALIFAHHAEVLDGIEEEVSSLGLKYIRIDGHVQPKKRFDLVNSFQNDEEVKVAVLSLTAAGMGLTLTAAKRVVFAEMYWTPAVLLQAEDRIHRIGQAEKTSVNYYYLYGDDTMDAVLYKILQKKIAVVSEILEGETKMLDLNGKEDMTYEGELTGEVIKEKSELLRKYKDQVWGDKNFAKKREYTRSQEEPVADSGDVRETEEKTVKKIKKETNTEDQTKRKYIRSNIDEEKDEDTYGGWIDSKNDKVTEQDEVDDKPKERVSKLHKKITDKSMQKNKESDKKMNDQEYEFFYGKPRNTQQNNPIESRLSQNTQKSSVEKKTKADEREEYISLSSSIWNNVNWNEIEKALKENRDIKKEVGSSRQKAKIDIESSPERELGFNSRKIEKLSENPTKSSKDTLKIKNEDRRDHENKNKNRKAIGEPSPIKEEDFYVDDSKLGFKNSSNGLKNSLYGIDDSPKSISYIQYDIDIESSGNSTSNSRTYFRASTEGKEEEGYKKSSQSEKDKPNRSMSAQYSNFKDKLFGSLKDKSPQADTGSSFRLGQAINNSRESRTNQSSHAIKSFAEMITGGGSMDKNNTEDPFTKFKGQKNTNQRSGAFTNKLGGIPNEIQGFRRNLRALTNEDPFVFDLEDDDNQGGSGNRHLDYKGEDIGKGSGKVREGMDLEEEPPKPNQRESQNSRNTVRRVKIMDEPEDKDDTFLGLLTKI